MTRRVLLFLMLLGLCEAAAALAQKTDEALFQSLQSPFFHLLEPMPTSETGDPDLSSRIFASDFLKYTPSSKTSVPEGPCRWDSVPVGPAASEREGFVAFKNRFVNYRKNCEGVLQNGSRNSLINAYLTLMIKMNLRENPQIRMLEMNLPSGAKLRGLLALKDNQPRPFILFRMGIFSNADLAYGERFLMKQLFEEGSFNVLMVESMTGPGYVGRNTERTFGVLEEGLQNLQILRALHDPREPLSRLVTSMHLLGVSMGAGGQFVTHVLQAFQKTEKPWVQSTLLLCPPLQMEQTVKSHFQDHSHTQFLNAWASKRLVILKNENLGLRPDFFLPDLMKYIESHYKGPSEDQAWIRWPSRWQESKKNFWKGQEEAIEYLKEVTDTPLMIVATHQDPIVPYHLNSGLLELKPELIGKAPVILWPLPEGYHCSLPGAYDWPQIGSIFRDFLQRYQR